MGKNDNIKASISATKQRRKNMVCRVYEVKVVKGKMSKEKQNHINGLFLEAKWLRNAVVGSDDIFSFNRDVKPVNVKCADNFEERNLVLLGSQMRQDVVDQVKSDIIGLAHKKEKGYLVGALKFKAFCNTIPLRQFGTTYRIDFEDKYDFHSEPTQAD